jgi:hypothetical protein
MFYFPAVFLPVKALLFTSKTPFFVFLVVFFNLSLSHAGVRLLRKTVLP